MMKFSAAVARILAAGVLIAVAGPAAAQQPYPNKPIRFIIPFAAGGTTEPLVRLVAQKLTESWGQQVIVDNRPGGNSLIGTEALAKSPPDGYTIMQTSITHVVLPLLFPTPYDAINDFAPVATLTSSQYLLVLHPSVPASNLLEFIGLAKSKPGQLNYSTPGNGTVSHLWGELFAIMAGVRIQNIPYKGAGPALTDLLGGQVQLSFTSPVSVTSYIRTGKLKAIAISRDSRSSLLPGVPTFTEAGLPGFNANNWFAVLAPARTPKEIISKLSTEIARILTMPDVKEKLVSQGLDPFISTPEQFAAIMKADTANFARIIRIANIKLEN